MRVLTLAELSFVAGGDYGGGGGGDDFSNDIVVTGPSGGGDDYSNDIVVTANFNNGSDDWGFTNIDLTTFDDSGDGGGSGSSAAASSPPDPKALPNGYHASPIDPDHQHYMVKDGDPDNKLVFTPQWQAQVDNGHINWAGVAYDLGVIGLSAVGGAGDGLRVVLGIAGGTLGGLPKPAQQ